VACASADDQLILDSRKINWEKSIEPTRQEQVNKRTCTGYSEGKASIESRCAARRAATIPAANAFAAKRIACQMEDLSWLDTQLLPELQTAPQGGTGVLQFSIPVSQGLRLEPCAVQADIVVVIHKSTKQCLIEG